MLKVNLTHSLDPLRDGEYQIHKNIVSLGDHHQNDLFITHNHLKNEHLIFEIENSKLYIRFHSEVESIHVNNKITKGKKLLSKHDKIQVNNVEIKILDYSHSIELPIQESVNNTLNELNSKDSPLLSILGELNE